MNAEKTTVKSRLIELGYSISSSCTDPGGYRAESGHQVAITGPNGQSFETRYTMGAAHRVWKAKPPMRLADFRGIVGKAGSKVPSCLQTKNHSMFEQEALEECTEPSKPELDDVLQCLLSDASMVRHGQTFEEWAGDFGYDTDSRKAEKCFNNCRDEWTGLIRIGADMDALDELFQDY